LDFFGGSGTSAEAFLRYTVNSGIKASYIQIQLQEKTKDGSEAAKMGYESIDQIGIERIIRAAAKIREEHPDTTADLGFKHFVLKEPTSETLDKLETFSDLTMSDDILSEFGLSTVLATWLVHDGYAFTAPVEAIDFAGYKGYYMKKHLYLIEPNLSDAAIEAVVSKYEADGDFNPENVVLFGYSFFWTELEALKTNLKRLKDTEKNLRINFDIRY
jgi:type III restriction enzyme/adenine-specific DNA-methyltransferase